MALDRMKHSCSRFQCTTLARAAHPKTRTSTAALETKLEQVSCSPHAAGYTAEENDQWSTPVAHPAQHDTPPQTMMMLRTEIEYISNVLALRSELARSSRLSGGVLKGGF